MNKIKFGDAVINMDEFVLLTGTTLVMKGGIKQRISVKAADALREWLTPLELRRSQPPQGLPCKDS